MRKLLESSGVALAGLGTSVLTALLVALINAWTGFNIFTFSLWFVVPVGAIGCGFVAALGYFFAAKVLHQHATKLLLAQMVVIAAVTQILIYWLEYRMLTVDGVSVATIIPFMQYLDLTLTSAHVQLRGTIDTGAVGSLGYWLAALDFIGFMIGGAGVYLYLGNQPKCGDCRKYLKSLSKKHDRFGDFQDFVDYFDDVYTHPVDSPEFAHTMRVSHKAKMAGAGTMGLTTILYQCPQCAGQSIAEQVQVFDGRNWQNADEYNRCLAMPAGVDVSPAFK
jgi:hypothetical protein